MKILHQLRHRFRILGAGKLDGFIIAAIVAVVVLFLVVGANLFFRPGHTISYPNACKRNLHLMQEAKQQWGLEAKKTANDVPTLDDLLLYMKAKPECPARGIYTLGTLKNDPTCSIGGEHSLSDSTR